MSSIVFCMSSAVIYSIVLYHRLKFSLRRGTVPLVDMASSGSGSLLPSGSCSLPPSDSGSEPPSWIPSKVMKRHLRREKILQALSSGCGSFGDEHREEESIAYQAKYAKKPRVGMSELVEPYVMFTPWHGTMKAMGKDFEAIVMRLKTQQGV